MSKLTELKIQNLTQAGRYADGNSLYLKVSALGHKSWSCRYICDGKRVQMGLGKYPEVNLKRARQKRNLVHTEVANGDNPLKTKRETRAILKRQNEMIFRIAAHECHNTKKEEWKNGKHQDQWISTLETYVFPNMGNKPVNDIGSSDVVTCLKPIWLTKVETAQRLRQRIELVLNWAKAMGYREGDNPASLKGNLEYLLPKQHKVVNHHPALSYEEVPDFWVLLEACHGVAADALRILILTATRSGEVRGAKWDEIDESNAVWTIPADRMKAGKVHQVPLSKSSLVIFQKRREMTNSHLVFEGQKEGKSISNMAMLSLMRRHFPKVHAVPHGFRSSFRDWAENQNFSHRAVEYCLAHTLKNKVEAAYQRDVLLEQRRDIMNAWQSHVTLAKHAEI